MGYLITAHVFREKPNFSRLAELPKSIGYRAYLRRAANLYLLDAFRASEVPQYPFQTLIPSADIPLEFPPALEPLERLYSRLVPLKLANAFKKCYINTALLLNHLLQVPVFSFASDTQLHAIATEELQAFAGITEAILGLGSFDPPEDESEWRLVASR